MQAPACVRNHVADAGQRDEGALGRVGHLVGHRLVGKDRDGIRGSGAASAIVTVHCNGAL